MNQPSKKEQANAHDIREMLGSVDDETVTAILQTGATANEILHALEWIEDDDYLGSDVSRRMSPATRKVYDILQAEREDNEEDR